MLSREKIVITGAAHGIGFEIAKLFKQQGAELALIDIDNEKLQQTASDLNSHYYPVDVADDEAFSQALLNAHRDMAGITTLVNNAGCGALASLHNYSMEEFEHITRVNLYSVFNACRTVIPLMLTANTGNIINITSRAATRPTFGEAPYCAAKAGVIALTQSVALEYGPYIRCNSIAPGFIQTPMTQPIIDADMITALLKQLPLSRVGNAEEVAKVALFLASNQSSYISGQDLAVDGGLTLPQAGVNDITKGFTQMLEAGNKKNNSH